MSAPANAVVMVGENGDIAFALKRLKRACAIVGLSREIRAHSEYLKPSMKKRLKAKRARARLAKTARRQASGEAERLARRGMTVDDL